MLIEKEFGIGGDERKRKGDEFGKIVKKKK
jgi:hypothetical protein